MFYQEASVEVTPGLCFLFHCCRFFSFSGDNRIPTKIINWHKWASLTFCDSSMSVPMEIWAQKWKSKDSRALFINPNKHNRCYITLRKVTAPILSRPLPPSSYQAWVSSLSTFFATQPTLEQNLKAPHDGLNWGCPLDSVNLDHFKATLLSPTEEESVLGYRHIVVISNKFSHSICS